MREMGPRRWVGAAAILTLAVLWPATAPGKEFVLLQSTTSTQNSGLLDDLLPRFTEATGVAVRVVAVGTGQAIKNAENGDGDVLLVHAREAEERFVAQGFGLERHDVMYNDFVIVGPRKDPAKIALAKGAVGALRRIAATQSPFTSRGDASGTHVKERALWKEAGIDPTPASGTWYRETGAGQGATLNVAVAMGAYMLTDRATWIAFGNKGDARILLFGDRRLFNPYSVIAVNPAKHPHINAKGAAQLIEWLVSKTGQDAIAAYRRDGHQLFFPSGPKPR